MLRDVFRRWRMTCFSSRQLAVVTTSYGVTPSLLHSLHLEHLVCLLHHPPPVTAVASRQIHQTDVIMVPMVTMVPTTILICSSNFHHTSLLVSIFILFNSSSSSLRHQGNRCQVMNCLGTICHLNQNASYSHLQLLLDRLCKALPNLRGRTTYLTLYTHLKLQLHPNPMACQL